MFNNQNLPNKSQINFLIKWRNDANGWQQGCSMASHRDTKEFRLIMKNNYSVAVICTDKCHIVTVLPPFLSDPNQHSILLYKHTYKFSNTTQQFALCIIDVWFIFPTSTPLKYRHMLHVPQKWLSADNTWAREQNKYSVWCNKHM